jgi:predicted Zn-dependent protease
VRPLKRAAIVVFMLAWMIVSAAQLAAGFVTEGCKWPGTGSNIYWNTNTSGDYYTQAVNAASDWTNTPTPIYMTMSSNPQWITVQANNYGSTGQDGVSYLICDQITGAFGPGTTSNWNTYYTDGYSSAARQSVMVHELGHAIGLAHTGGSPCSIPIMYPSSERYSSCGYINPQQDDVNGVNYIY